MLLFAELPGAEGVLHSQLNKQATAHWPPAAIRRVKCFDLRNDHLKCFGREENFIQKTLSRVQPEPNPIWKPTGYGPNSRRLHNRGIVDECCFQSCELKRLEMYCAVKSGKATRSVREQRHTDTSKTPKKPISGHSQTPCKEVHQKNSSRGNTGGRNYRM
ncbi:insulin-like growth factor I isoform X2 [Tachysurus ichikawai]